MLEFQDQPYGLIERVSRQIWDEGCHAPAVYRRKEEVAVVVSDYPANHKTAPWDVTTNLGLGLRLSIHQKIGEWVGVDAAIDAAKDLRLAGQHEAAHIFEYMTYDEIAHVDLGNTWINSLARDDAEVESWYQQALELQQQAGEHVPLEGKPQPAAIRQALQAVPMTDSAAARADDNSMGGRVGE